MATWTNIKLLHRACPLRITRLCALAFLTLLVIYLVFMVKHYGDHDSRLPAATLEHERSRPIHKTPSNEDGVNQKSSTHWIPNSNPGHLVQEPSSRLSLQSPNSVRFGSLDQKMKLAVSSCGDRMNDTLVTLKSAVALTNSPLHLIIMTDDANIEKFHDTLLNWPGTILNRISFEIHPVTFPEDEENAWKQLFKPCAAQRLFFPMLLQDVDAVLYTDIDVIFLTSVDAVWNFFSKMNSSQLVGMAPESEDFATGWYNRFARHPYYGPFGLNTGVFLMNLTRMRAFHWESYLAPIYKEYKLKIAWGDQDIINIIFHFHPEKVYIFPCEWNFRTDHCMYASVCRTVTDEGVSVLHGSRGVFHSHKQPSFKAIYDIFAAYELGTDMELNLVHPIKTALKETTDTNCGKIHHVYTKVLEHTVAHLKQHDPFSHHIIER